MLVALAVASTALVSPGCSKSPEITAESIDDNWALTEQHEPGSVVMTVAQDGKVTVLVKDRNGKAIEEGVTGNVTVKVPGKDGAPVTAELVPEPKSRGVLLAKIPPLEDDLTEVNYEFKVKGEPFKGVLHVPRGGTRELQESAKENQTHNLDGKKGPNGGVLQPVGDDIVEIVADKTTGDVRVYVLDLNLKPVPIGQREIKLAIHTASGPDVIVLTTTAAGSSSSTRARARAGANGGGSDHERALRRSPLHDPRSRDHSLKIFTWRNISP
ncbi:hypothetical protein WMF30_31530 [Sorangium sp. So ce134]